jgi:isopentenyl-diphosphate Delta-isomerase
MANIGGTELAAKGCEPTLEALKRIGANGLTIHLNPAMELIQPGGETDFCGVADAIFRLVDKAPDLPVVVKETGCGLSFLDGELLKKNGVTSVEVAGAGGTSWVGVETLRATERPARLGEMLWDWGVPTAVSTVWLVRQGFEVVASGGIRTGLDAARALALGARLVGVAAPLVQEYFADVDRGVEHVRDYFLDLIHGLRAVLFLVGAKQPGEMTSLPKVLGPDLERWIAARGEI